MVSVAPVSWPLIVLCYMLFFFLMIRRQPRSTRTDTLFPYTTLFRSGIGVLRAAAERNVRVPGELSVIGFDDIQMSRYVYPALTTRSEEHTSELQSLMRISYAVFCLKKKKQIHDNAMKRHQATHIR